jgi:quercetin dioxygenase-like cupin family protein
VAEGELIFFLGGVTTKLGPGDLYTAPPNVPHSIQLLTEHARLVNVLPRYAKTF